MVSENHQEITLKQDIHLASHNNVHYHSTNLKH